jgi:hypothetical protein
MNDMFKAAQGVVSEAIAARNLEHHELPLIPPSCKAQVTSSHIQNASLTQRTALPESYSLYQLLEVIFPSGDKLDTEEVLSIHLYNKDISSDLTWT